MFCKNSVCEWVPSVLFALLNVKSFIKTICKHICNFPFCRRGSAWPWVAPAFCTGRCSRSWMKWSSMNTTTYKGHQAVRGMPYSCLPWWVGYSEGLGIMSYLGFISVWNFSVKVQWRVQCENWTSYGKYECLTQKIYGVNMYQGHFSDTCTYNINNSILRKWIHPSNAALNEKCEFLTFHKKIWLHLILPLSPPLSVG